jgi:hypothetical protein
VILVIGSPKTADRRRPAPYPRQDRQPWKPAESIPGREPEGLRRLLDFMRRRDEAARAMMTPDMAMLGAFMRLQF